MKILILFLFTLPVYAQSFKSINPKSLHTSLFKVFRSYSIHGEEANVRGVLYSRGEYIEGGNSFKIKTSLLERAQNLALSVFEARAGDDYNSFGTAFHVGDNFVLTNQHVLSTSRQNTTSCRSFSLNLNANQNYKTLKCKKVHYCDKELDFCLIEMKEHKRGFALKKQIPPRFNTSLVFGENLLLMSLGNTMGQGIHAGLGYGYRRYQRLGLFFAPVFGGNSGGPLINENDEVMAVVRSQSPELVSDNAYNVSIPMHVIKEELEKHLSPLVLSKLNF